MDIYENIALSEFCNSHGISPQFVLQWHEYGLIEIIHEAQTPYIHHEELPKAERIIRLHTELDINLEGIEVIQQLLHRINGMQEEINLLRNKLRRFE